MDDKHFADVPTPPAPDEEARLAAEATVMLVQIFDRMEEASPEVFRLLRTIASRATPANTATNPQAPVDLPTAGQGARTRRRRGPRSSKPCGLCSSQKLRCTKLQGHPNLCERCQRNGHSECPEYQKYVLKRVKKEKKPGPSSDGRLGEPSGSWAL